MKMKWRSFRSSSSCSSSNGDAWVHVLEVSVGRGTRVITVPASPWTWSWWIMDILKTSKVSSPQNMFWSNCYNVVKFGTKLIILYNIWIVCTILIWFHVFFFYYFEMIYLCGIVSLFFNIVIVFWTLNIDAWIIFDYLCCFIWLECNLNEVYKINKIRVDFWCCLVLIWMNNNLSWVNIMFKIAW